MWNPLQNPELGVVHVNIGQVAITQVDSVGPGHGVDRKGDHEEWIVTQITAQCMTK